MNSSNEKSKTVAKLIFFISMILLISLIVILINPFNFSDSTSSEEKPDTTDLKKAHENIIEKFEDYRSKIETSRHHADDLNVSINELKTYTNELPKYAIGGGISFIIGLWMSTYILYRKERNELFEE